MCFIRGFHGPALVLCRSFLTSEFNWLILGFSWPNTAISERIMESLMLGKTFWAHPTVHHQTMSSSAISTHFLNISRMETPPLPWAAWSNADNVPNEEFFLISTFPGTTWAHSTHAYRERSTALSSSECSLYLFVDKSPPLPPSRQKCGLCPQPYKCDFWPSPQTKAP